MNLQEYTVSLQQQKNPKLKPKEIIAKVEEWKKNNTQPEVEEIVEVDETSNQPIGEAGPAGAPPVKQDPYGIRSSSSILSDKPVNLSSTTEKTGMDLGEIQSSLGPEEARREYEELMYSIAEPEETYNPEGDPYEYKYSLNPGDQPMYYARPKDSSDEWSVHEIDSDQGFEIGAKVFNHIKIDDDAYNVVQATINKTIEGGDAVSDYLKSGDLTEGTTSMEDAFEGKNYEVIKQNVEKSLPTEDEQVVLTQDAADFIDDDLDFSEFKNILSNRINENPKLKDPKKFDEDFKASRGGFEMKLLPPLKKELKKRGLTLKMKEPENDWESSVNDWLVEAENGEVYDLGKINNELDLSGLEEFAATNGNQATYMEIAAQQVAKEMYGEGGNTAQLNKEDPEVIAAINKKAKALKFQTLKKELHLEKLENILEDDRTDFSFDGLKLLAMFPTYFDNTIVFQSSSQNKSLQKYYKTTEDNLTKKEENLTNFLKNGKDLLASLDGQQLALKKSNYQTPAQVTQANRLITGLQKQKEDVISLMNEKYDELSEEYKNNPNLEELIDKASRNYGVVPLMINNIKASTVQIGVGTANLVSEAFELYGATAEAIDNATGSKVGTIGLGIANPLYGIARAFGATSNIKEWHDNGQELAEKFVEGLKGDVAESKSIEDLSGWGDYITYGSTTVGQVTPQIVAIVAAPNYGLGVVVASAGGGELAGYEAEEKESKKAQEEWDSGTGQFKNKPKKLEGESDENFQARMDDFTKLNPRPKAVRYNELEKWGGALSTMSLEAATGYFIKIPLSQGKSIVNPLLKRAKTIAKANPTANKIFRNTWSKNFNKYVNKGLEWTGDVGLEGLEEVGVEVGGKLYDRWVLGKDVNLFEGNWDVFAAGAIGGIGFKSVGMFQPFLSPVQTPGDVADITGLQNEIKEIDNLMSENPNMDQATKDRLNKQVKDKIQAITNRVTNSANLYTKFSEADFNEIGNLDQRMYNINSEIDQILNDDGIKVGKQTLIDSLRNEYNKLTGEKNKILEKYSEDGATAGEVFKPGVVVDPIYDIDKLRKGSEVVVDQLGDADIVRFDNSEDFLGGVETLREQGQQIDLATNEKGEVLPAEDQSYGLIAVLPDGTKQIIINNASSEVDGVPPADKHETLHLFARKMDPAVLAKMGEDLYNTLLNDTGDVTSRIEIDPRTKKTLELYKKQYDDGILTKEEFYEEVMAVASDGLTRKGIKVKDTGPFLNLLNKFLEKIGFKQSFEDGKQALDFLQAFNKDVMSGQGLSQDTLDTAGVTLDTKTEGDVEVDMDLETEVDLGTIKKSDTVEVERLRDNQIPVSAQEFTYDDGDGNINIAVVKTNLDGSRQLELKSPDGSVITTEKISKNNTLSNKEYTEASVYGEVSNAKDLDIKTIRNPKVDERMSNRQRKAAGLPIKSTPKKAVKKSKKPASDNLKNNPEYQKDLNDMTPNQRLALEGKGPLTMIRNAAGKLVMGYGTIAEALDGRKSPYRNTKGKSGIPVKRSEKLKEPLDAINDLMPESVKTKKQFDAFMRDNKTALPIASALLPGGVINNYIRSRETSREQGDKMIDEMYERIFNFNPEATRADGTIVGPQGFGESIFANTRFAKMVANKDLAKEGETKKSTRSIDSEDFVETPTTSKDKTKKDSKPKQKRKSQLPRETTKFTTDFASNLNINTEGKTPKQIEEEIQKQFDKAIAEDLKSMPVNTFGETRNIGPALAALMEKATGMPAKVFTDKSQNIQKKDAASGALTALKQYLYNNAQRDFNNLPDAFDTATGKANFIPENIKREFYKKDSKGKFVLDKSKSLKDYQDLLGDMDKPVYRATEAQTIKGLIGLSLRNRIFEQAVPDPIARKTTGVKFSIKPEDVNEILDAKNIEGIKKIAGLIDGGNFDNLTQKQKIGKFIELFKVLAEKGISRGGLFKSGNLTSAGLKLARLLAQQKYTGLRFIQSLEGLDQKIDDTQTILDNTPGAVTIQLGDGKTVFSREKLEENIEQYKETKKAVEKGEVGLVSDLLNEIDNNKDTANKNISKVIKPNPQSRNPKVAQKSVQDNIANVDDIQQGIKDLLDIVYDLPKDLQVPFLRMFHGDSMYNNNIGRQIGALLGDMGVFPLGKDGKPLAITNEHALQFGAYTKIIGLALNLPRAADVADGKPNFDVIRDWLSKNIFQVALADIPGRDNQETSYPEGTKGVFDSTESKEAWQAQNQLEPFLRDIIQDYIDGKISAKDLNKVSSLTRYFNEYFYLNPFNVRIYNPKTKKVESIAEVYGTQIPPSVVRKFKGKNLSAVDAEGLAVYQDVEKRVAFATMKRVRGEWTKAEAQKYLKLTIPLALKQDTAKVNIAKEASEIIPVKKSEKVEFVPKTTSQVKDVLENSLNTRVNANKVNPKVKGISVFDFDDTLAKTKEKVIVINNDGSIKEISASQFAKNAATLTEEGAEFDFSNFENVAKDTEEGPLADLARKRQGKFGSGDIFVLTARPNSAGPAIQQFLKSIGINIPLKNITGLSDGTPQAKADWVLNKTAEGYNDFYFADDSFANVAGVKAVLDAVDVKNKVQQAKVKKSEKLTKDINKILEEVTGTKAFKTYSTARARLEGKKKDGGLFKRFLKQFTITPSADDFAGLTYAFRGEGEQGNKHAEWIEDNLIQPYNKAELELMSAKISVANDFAELKKQFPNLKTKRNAFGVKQNPLLAEVGDGTFTKSQAVRVYMWNKQGMEIPGMSKRDINTLVKAVESDMELQVFADEVILIQKDSEYPPPTENWLAGDMKSDILNGMDKGFRQKLLTEFNENVKAIFTPEVYNKLEALYGSKYIEALKDSLRRMKSGSNRPVYQGGGARIINDMLDWLNASVGVTMFLNQKSGLLQTLSTVNFINWGDNNIYAAAKAFASKEYFPTVLRLLNSPYLVNRRDGLKINVNEAELVDAGKKGGFQGMVSFLLEKGFVFTRIADSLAIAVGGSTFFINRKKALLKRVNKDTGELYTEAEADTKAFEDFYAVAEETQQSSNPSKISQQQASLGGRVLLSFQNVTMQFNRKTKKSVLDFVKRRKKPGLTQRESDMSNLSSVMYYVGMQNLIFNSLQQALFSQLFDEEEEKDKNKVTSIANGMLDSLLFGLGFGGALVSTIKNVSMRMYRESQKKSPDYEDPLWDLFDVSPVIDSKIRKLRQAAKTVSWNRKEMKRRGWSLDNPAYLAVSQIVSAFLNLPADRVMNLANNMSNVMDEETRMWQKIALSLGWSPYILNLPYWGRQSTIDKEAKEDEKLKVDYAKAVKNVKSKGFTKKIPLSGENHYIPKGKLGVDYMQVERIDGTIQYYVKHKK